MIKTNANQVLQQAKRLLIDQELLKMGILSQEPILNHILPDHQAEKILSRVLIEMVNQEITSLEHQKKEILNLD